MSWPIRTPHGNDLTPMSLIFRSRAYMLNAKLVVISYVLNFSLAAMLSKLQNDRIELCHSEGPQC